MRTAPFGAAHFRRFRPSTQRAFALHWAGKEEFHLIAGREPRFTDYPLHPSILTDIAEIGYTTPTPIQAECLTHALEGKDVLGLAQTGTGKTAAFALPIIQRVARTGEMAALILAPTRELAQQISAAFAVLGKSSDVRVATIVGGIPIKQDYRALQAWPNVLVATPGRLIDHIQSGTIVLKEIKVLAIDEADRMYDMGFMPQINRIIAALPKDRQTMMFTATMPPDVEELVRRNMRDPVKVKVGLTAPVDRAEQKLFSVHDKEKLPLLMKLLGETDGRALVFVRTKRKSENLYRAVSTRFHGVARLHGDREQTQRDVAMTGFRSGKFRILIATDIAARGLDVAEIEHVINYDFPGSAEDYIHRIGRTARVAASGLASSFVTGLDRPVLHRLEKLIGTQLMPRSEGGEAALPHEGRGGQHHADKAAPAGQSRRRRRGGRGRSERAHTGHAHAGHAQAEHAHAGHAHAEHPHAGHAKAEHAHAGHAHTAHAHSDHAQSGHGQAGHAHTGHAHTDAGKQAGG